VVIPILDHNPVRRTPYVTYALIVINFAVFLFGPTNGLLHGGSDPVAAACAQQRFLLHYGAIPQELLSGHPLAGAAMPRVSVSASDGTLTSCTLSPNVGKVPALSVLTAMFVHAGWLHLLGNMLFLYVFGNNVEDRLGRVHFALFYLAGGYLATYGYAVVNADSNVALVGASGAIASVCGAYLVLFPRVKVTALSPFLFFLPLRFPAWMLLGAWFALQMPAVLRLVGQPTNTGVGYAAHLVGFSAGVGYLLLIAALRRRAGASRTDPARASRPDLSPAGEQPKRPADIHGV
jgi:membrane associated rhomboid family serine protease